MGDSLGIVNNDLSAMKLDDNFDEKFIQLKEIYEKYKKEIENLKITIENKDKEIGQLKNTNIKMKKAIGQLKNTNIKMKKAIGQLKEINEDNEIMKNQMKVQVKKIQNILPKSTSNAVKNFKSAVEIFQNLVKYGPYDVENQFRISKAMFTTDFTNYGKRFYGEQFQYRYKLGFVKSGNECCVKLYIEPGNHDENLQWPFNGVVRVTVSQDDYRFKRQSTCKQYQIERDQNDTDLMTFNLQNTVKRKYKKYFSEQDTKTSEDVVIKCWIFPSPQMLQSAS